MKKIFIGSSILVSTVLVLSACSPKVLDFSQADVANGKIYARGSNNGFSGKVDNISVMAFINTQEGAEPLLRATLNAVIPDRDKGGPGGLLSRIPCQVQVKDGELDGDVLCMDPRSKVKLLETSFKDGLLDGPFTLYSQEPGNAVQSTVKFSKGKANGTHEVFSDKTHKLILRGNWNDGVREGREEGFHPDTGSLISVLTWKNEKRDGEVVRYAPDGKRVIYKANYVDGKKEGLEVSFDPETGIQTGHVEYSKDRSHGVVKRWSRLGFIDRDEVHENGRAVEIFWDTSFDEYKDGRRDCLTAWLKAFRREQGSRPELTLEQVNGWRELCSQGKIPDLPAKL